MPRKTRAQPPFTILVDGLIQGSDPSRGTAGNPVRSRRAYEFQVFTTDGNRYYNGLSEGEPPAPATATLTVADDDHTTGYAYIYIGDYQLVADVDYVTGGGVNATATNIAAAISRLKDFSATALGAVVSIDGPLGLDGETWRFEGEYGGSKTNYTLVPADGFLTSGDPHIGPPDLIV